MMKSISVDELVDQMEDANAMDIFIDTDAYVLKAWVIERLEKIRSETIWTTKEDYAKVDQLIKELKNE